MSVNGNLFVPLGGFGRNVNHDPASKAFKAARFGAVEPRSVEWTPHGPALDQGDLGRCVPTAGTAMLTCEPFWSTLHPDLQRILLDPVLREGFAIQAYREVTALDPFQGTWEPDDTGSDGLSLWKLFRARGYVGGSEHVMGIEDAHAAIQKGPYPIGISWISGMDQPGTDGVVSISGTNRGGHEVLLYRYDAVRDLWWCRNSWGTGWGKLGDFAFDTPGYMKLMAMQADGTPMTPVNKPAPVPVPVPQPASAFPFGPMDTWAGKVKKRLFSSAYERQAVIAYQDWRAGQK